MDSVAARIAILLAGVLGVLAVAFVVSGDEDPLVAGATIAEPASGLEAWACPGASVGGVECGYLTVPADYDDPDGPTARIFAATVSAPLEATGPPLLVLGDQLGPGAARDFADWRVANRQLERDIVLVDHRGTGLSDPQVNCNDLGKVRWLEVDLWNDAAVDLRRDERREAINTCAQRLSGLPGRPDFSQDAMIADLQSLRSVLGIDRWVVVGSGETVPLALSLEQAAPDTVAGLVLLRAAPLTTDPFGQRISYAEEALAAALTCAGPDCTPIEPTVVDEAQESLGQRSVVFTVPVEDRQERVAVNRGSLFSSLSLVVNDPETRVALPSIVARMAESQWREVALLRGRRYPTHEYGGVSVLLAQRCQTPKLTTSGLDLADEERRPWLGLLDDPSLDPGVCRRQARSLPDGPPQSSTLIVNSAFDYLAPRSAAGELTRAWPEADSVVLVDDASPDLFDPCTLSVVEEFLGGSSPTLDSCG